MGFWRKLDPTNKKSVWRKAGRWTDKKVLRNKIAKPIVRSATWFYEAQAAAVAKGAGALGWKGADRVGDKLVADLRNEAIPGAIQGYAIGAAFAGGNYAAGFSGFAPSAVTTPNAAPGSSPLGPMPWDIPGLFGNTSGGGSGGSSGGGSGDDSWFDDTVDIGGANVPVVALIAGAIAAIVGLFFILKR